MAYSVGVYMDANSKKLMTITSAGYGKENLSCLVHFQISGTERSKTAGIIGMVKVHRIMPKAA